MVINHFLKNGFMTLNVINEKTRFFRSEKFFEIGNWTF
jgi:hypothetical protein